MSKLIYFMPMSLDGFIADENSTGKQVMPDDAVLAFISDLHRPIGTYLYGRKNYEMMTVWETPDVIPGLTPAMKDFAPIWQSAEKIVYSRSLASVATPRTRLVREFEPQAIRDLKEHLPHDISVAGPNLATQAARAGLVDEYHLLVSPAILGSGLSVLPDAVNVSLELLDERRVGSGWVYLRYSTQG